MRKIVESEERKMYEESEREREGTEGKILFPQTKIHWSGNNSRNYCCMQFWITL